MLIEKIQECTHVQLIILLVAMIRILALLCNVSSYVLCIAKLMMMHCNCLIYVTVIPMILSEITDLSDEGRGVANFTCQAVGEPVPGIIWYFNDVMINVSDNRSKYMIMSRSLNITTTENTLTVYNLTSSDMGVYTCIATNTQGNDTQHGKIISFFDTEKSYFIASVLNNYVNI